MCVCVCVCVCMHERPQLNSTSVRLGTGNVLVPGKTTRARVLESRVLSSGHLVMMSLNYAKLVPLQSI